MPTTPEGHKIRFTINPEEFAKFFRQVDFPPVVESEKASPLIVMKFGGTSVGSAKMIDTVSGIVVKGLEDGNNVVVVVSALSGITNSLEILGSDTSNVFERERELRIILDRHTTASTELPISPILRNETEDVLIELFSRLNRDVHDLTLTGKERRDSILSFGERMSSQLVAAMLKERGVKALAIDSGSIISTNDTFGEAVPDLEVTRTQAREYLLPLLKNRITPIVTGFLGSTPDGKPTTLGRGGSDYSASLLGKVLDAYEVWIWTDVDGIYTADPRINPDATLIPEIDMAEADRMAKNGAKVLQSKTLEPLFRTTTALRVLNTFNPGNTGTRVVDYSVAHNRA